LMTMQFMAHAEISIKAKHNCPKCMKTFDEPELISFHACPHCHAKIEEAQTPSCQYWLGYLNQKEKGESIPQDCVECEKAIECMLDPQHNTTVAAAEIKKWY
jgi:hypothetical protein